MTKTQRTRIPQAFIDELLARVDLIELIDSYVPLTRRGKNATACCPFHQEKSPSFNVMGDKHFYHCFGCGTSGNAISFVMQHLGQPFREAIETLAVREGLVIPKALDETRVHTNLYTALEEVCAFYQKSLANSPAMAYLKKRGIQPEMIDVYQLGYAPAGWHALETQFPTLTQPLIETGMLIQKEEGKIYDRYRHRLMFPIRDRQGRLIGFGGRALDDEQTPKYLNSPETVLFQKHRELYGLHQVVNQPQVPYVLVVEGYLDVLALTQFDLPYAVAALGTATHPYQIERLIKHSPSLYFCFDGDAAGKRAADRALTQCLPLLEHEALDIRFIFLPEGHDPDSFLRAHGKAAFVEQCQTAIPLHTYLLTSVTHDLDIATLVGKNQLLHRVKPLLEKIPTGTYKTLLLEELTKTTRISSHALQGLTKDEIPTQQSNKRVNIKRSPLRVAMALLIQNPHLYASLKSPLIEAIPFTGDAEIVQRLLDQIAANPTHTSASLVEAWRDTPWFDAFNKLAIWDHLIPPEMTTQELRDTLLFLQKQNRNELIDLYIEKSKQTGLTGEERETLQQLLKSKMQSNLD